MREVQQGWDIIILKLPLHFCPFHPTPSLTSGTMLEHVQDGYPGLAKLMGPNFDQGFGMFRKFTELNARNLLYMQAEMLCLEQELDMLTYVDKHGPDLNAKAFVRSVWEMRKVLGSAQWSKILELRGKLNSYSMCSCLPLHHSY